MNKQKFVHILNNRKSIGQEDLKKIELLEKDYPYSQVLHTLSAVISYSRKEKNSKQKLSTAAVYSTDRSVLKDLVLAIDRPANVTKTTTPNQGTNIKTKTSITQPSRVVAKSSTVQTKTETAKVAVKTSKSTVIDQPSGHPGNLTKKEAEELRQEVMKNLEDLMLVKSKFMKMVDQEEVPKKQVKKKSEKVSKKKAGKVKKVQTKAKKEKVNPKKRSKKETKTENPTKKSKKEQSQIIERFIKVDPKIKQAQNTDLDSQNDLSKQSVKFGEDLVSENLAKIMIKQGKMSKAVDIYKKLIWKYPQKKAYFASQIESLKEK